MSEKNTDNAAARKPLTNERVVVEMAGPSGNAYAVMGAVAAALKRTGHADKVADYLRRATSGDYENLLAVSGEFVTIVRV